MPVKTIDVVEGAHVDEGLDLIDIEEVADNVEVGTAVAEAGRVVNDGLRHGDRLGKIDRKRLAQGLHAVEHSRGRCTLNGDTFRGDCDAVGFGIIRLQAGFQLDDALRSAYRQIGKVRAHEVTLAAEILRRDDFCVAAEHKGRRSAEFDFN